MEDKISELVRAIYSLEKNSSISFPQDLRLFLISDKSYIRIYNKKMSACYYESTEYFHLGKHLRCDRGAILDIFSKLEFIINEFIRLKFLDVNSDDGYMLDDLLENVDLFTRVKLLNKWKIIDNRLKELIIQTKQVRNGFAHAWDKAEVYYKGKQIQTNLSQFRNDMHKILDKLIDIYMKEQEKIDVEAIIENIKKLKDNG